MHKFQTRPISIVCALMLPAMLILDLGNAFGRDDTSTTYRCTAKDAVSILQDGTLNRDIAKAALEAFDKVVIDVSDGHVTYPSSGKREEWTVETTSVDDNDYVLFPSSSFRLNKTVANAAIHFIRLRATPNEPQPRFMIFTLSYLVTGTCEIVR